MRALGPHSVVLQDYQWPVLTDAQGNSILTLKPDAVIRKLDDPPVILDTKWKRLTPGKKRLGVADSDVYQMLAYARAYNAKRLILIYPWHEEMGAQQKVIRTWFVAGTNCRLDVATVGVGRPRRSRECPARNLRVRADVLPRGPLQHGRLPECR